MTLPVLNAAALTESGGDPVVTKYYFHGGKRVAMDREGVLQYLAGDHLGSTSLVMDDQGGKVAESRHYPYGEERWRWPEEGTFPTDYRFTGQRSDSHIKLVHMGARHYDPALGRWTSADSIVPDPTNPRSFNRYAYVRNSPLNFVDPTGHAECVDDECNLVVNPVTGNLRWRRPKRRLPATRYYVSKVYGHVDTSHLRTGSPARIIEDTEQTIDAGGGEIEIPGRVSALGGAVWFRYIGTYRISGNAEPEDALGIAFGLYMDWGHRFEEWEGSFALDFGDDTSFAIEDLPSHYIGFAMAATGLSPEETFAMLGEFQGTNDELPRNVRNHTYNPWVDDRLVPWPDLFASLMPTPIDSGDNTWVFVRGSCVGFGCNFVSNPEWE